MFNIISKEEYIKGMSSGIHAISELLKPTFGGKGTNIIVESKLYPYFQTTNDAQTIVQSVKTESKAERIAVNSIKELCNRQDKLLGNGRKTTILMADKLLQLGNEYNGDKNQLKRDLDSLIPIIETEIDGITTKITENEIEMVATTASESSDIGKLLQEIYKKIGRKGIIQPEGSNTYETSYRVIDGVRFDMASMLSPFMVHNDKSKAVYKKPIILVTKKKIMSDDDINPILNEMNESSQKDLVIFTSDMDTGVAQMLIDLHKSNRFNICIIKVPTLWRDYYYEDFSKCVGATVIEDGMSFKNMHLTMLGTCDKITVDSEETILIGTKDITEHIAQLQQNGDDDSHLRLSWLNNKTAILKLGSNSEQDLSLKLLKCRDAIRSSESALKYGIVKGGGLCLYEISASLPNTDAGNILQAVLQVPSNINIENGVKEIPDNIVDASMVVKLAVRHAIGLASPIITASALTYLPEEPIIKEQQHAFQ